jgi:hypothetical protein
MIPYTHPAHESMSRRAVVSVSGLILGVRDTDTAALKPATAKPVFDTFKISCAGIEDAGETELECYIAFRLVHSANAVVKGDDIWLAAFAPSINSAKHGPCHRGHLQFPFNMPLYPDTPLLFVTFAATGSKRPFFLGTPLGLTVHGFVPLTLEAWKKYGPIWESVAKRDLISELLSSAFDDQWDRHVASQQTNNTDKNHHTAKSSVSGKRGRGGKGTGANSAAAATLTTTTGGKAGAGAGTGRSLPLKSSKDVLFPGLSSAGGLADGITSTLTVVGSMAEAVGAPVHEDLDGGAAVALHVKGGPAALCGVGAMFAGGGLDDGDVDVEVINVRDLGVGLLDASAEGAEDAAESMDDDDDDSEEEESSDGDDDEVIDAKDDAEE